VSVSLGSYDARFPYSDWVLLAKGDPELGDLVQVKSPKGGRLKPVDEGPEELHRRLSDQSSSAG
jgi:hypothetical protein